MVRYPVRESKLHHISFPGLCISFLLVYHYASLINFLFTQQPQLSAASVHTVPIITTKNDIATSKPFMCCVFNNITGRQVFRIGRVLGLAEGVGPLNKHPTVPRPKTQITGGLLLSTAMVCLVNVQSWPTWSLLLTRMCWFSRRLRSTILSIRLNFYQQVIVVLPARTEIDQVVVSWSPLNRITV